VDDHEHPVIINLDNVAKLAIDSHGTAITHVGMSDIVTIVKETPDQILVNEAVRKA